MSELSVKSAPCLGLLGGFHLGAGETIRPSRAVQRLLAYLAVRGGTTLRAALRTDLWPESDATHASACLRSALWRSPRPGGRPLVQTYGGRISLAPDVHVDLWHSIAEARRLTNGENLDGPIPSYEPFADELLPDWSEDWLLIEQESYRQLRLHALERTSALLHQQGHYAEALQAALLAVRGEPLRESAHRQVIAVHLAEGNPAEALRQFHTCRRLLAAELGLPPSRATRDMVAHLLGRPVDGP